MTASFDIRPQVLLAAMMCSFVVPVSSQEIPQAPAPESFLKIINEQLAAMANTTFELDYSFAANTGNAAGGGEMMFDENGNVLSGGNKPASSAMTLGMRLQVQFANLSEYCVTQMSPGGTPRWSILPIP